jgi:catechol 2,3-dioxygenase-like lactoylglutathione lyase family enzyme
MIKDLNHIGLSVVELDRSIRFCRDVFGMAVVGQVTFEDEQHEEVLALNCASGRAPCYVRMKVEIVEFAHPASKGKSPGCPVGNHGLSHFFLEVLDIDFEYKRLDAAGVFFHCPSVDFSDGAEGTHARDLDGYLFELLEFTSERGLGLSAARVTS